MTLDQLSEEAIEEGVNTAFVQALVGELRKRGIEASRALMQLSAAGDSSARVYAMGGRALAYDDILRLIERTKGAT